MKIKYIHDEDDDGFPGLTIFINGKCWLDIWSMNECPKDATLLRELSFVYEIGNLCKQAHEAGKNGDEFIFIEEHNNEKNEK